MRPRWPIGHLTATLAVIEAMTFAAIPSSG